MWYRLARMCARNIPYSILQSQEMVAHTEGKIMPDPNRPGTYILVTEDDNDGEVELFQTPTAGYKRQRQDEDPAERAASLAYEADAPPIRTHSVLRGRMPPLTHIKYPHMAPTNSGVLPPPCELPPPAVPIAQQGQMTDAQIEESMREITKAIQPKAAGPPQWLETFGPKMVWAPSISGNDAYKLWVLAFSPRAQPVFATRNPIDVYLLRKHGCAQGFYVIETTHPLSVTQLLGLLRMPIDANRQYLAAVNTASDANVWATEVGLGSNYTKLDV